MKRYLPACLLLISVGANGALNKWVDADGKVHYSDEAPPENVKAKTLTAPPLSGDAPVPQTLAEREAERKKAKRAKEETAQKAAKQQEEEQAKKDECNRLRANLSTLANSPRIVTYDANGESVIMGDEARQQKVDEINKQIGISCK